MKMTTKKMMGLLAVAAPLMVNQASAEIEGSVSAGYHSMYEFRGANQGDGLVDASIALSTEYNGITFAGNVWYASTNDDEAFVDNEADYTLTASKTFGAVTATLGYIFYSYPEDNDSNSQEIFLALSGEIGYGIVATGSAFYDFDLYEGFYFSFDLGKSFEINEQLAFNLNAGLGLYEGYDGFDDGVNHYYIKAGFAWTPKENLTVSPYVKFTDASSDFPSDFTTGSGEFGDENFITGVTLSVAF